MGIASGLLLSGGAMAGNLLGANQQAKAAKSAAELQAQAAQSANDMQMRMFQQSRQDQMPWMQQGQKSLAQLAAMTAPGGEMMRDFSQADFQADPGYQYRQQQAMNQVQRAMAARGLGSSGALYKALQDRASSMAGDEFTNAYNRFNQQRQMRYNSLAGLANTGQAQAQALANQGAASAADYGQNLGQAANAIAAGRVGAAQSRQNALSDLVSLGTLYGVRKGII